MNPEEIQRRLDAVTTELRGLVEMSTRSADQEARVDELIAQANTIGAELARALSARGILATDHQSRQSAGRISGAVGEGEGQPGGGETRSGGDAIDVRSLGQRVYESDEMDALRRSGGEGRASFQLRSFFHPGGGFVYEGENEPAELRALTTVAGLPAAYLQPLRVPGIMRPQDQFGSLRDVLNVGQTAADAIVFFRENVFTNAAATVGEATATTGTSGAKPESGITFTQATSNVSTIAHWIPITRQTIWNAPELQSYIEGRLIDGLRLVEDDQLLNGDGTGNNITGLNNTTGTQVLDAAYFTATPVEGVGTDNELFNRILRARVKIAEVGRARANFIVLNPADHERYLAATDGNSQYFGPGPFSGAAIPTIWGMRVVENENQVAGTALVGDGRMATIWDRMAAQVLAGTINDQFTRNMITLLAEERVGLTVFRPSAFAEVALPA